MNTSTGDVTLARMPAAQIGRALVVLGVSLGYLTYLFRPFHSAFWNTGMGDWMDPYFINYLLEHGTRALRPSSDPASPPMYFPVAHTLGYSHGLILYVPFYVAIRLFVHPFPAYGLALAAVMETGIVCLYLLLRRRFRLSFLESAADRVFLHVSECGQRLGQHLVSARVGVPDPAHPVPRRHVVWHDGSLLENWRRRADRTAGGIALHPRLLHGAVRRVLRGAGRHRLCLRISLTNLVAFWRSLGRTERRRSPWSWPRLRGPASLECRAVSSCRLAAVRMNLNWRRPAWLAGLFLLVFLALRRDHWLGAIPAWFDRWLRAWAAGVAVGAMVFLWVYFPAILENRSFPDEDVLNALTARDPWHAYRSLGSLGLVLALGTSPSFRGAAQTAAPGEPPGSIAISLIVLSPPGQERRRFALDDRFSLAARLQRHPRSEPASSMLRAGSRHVGGLAVDAPAPCGGPPRRRCDRSGRADRHGHNRETFKVPPACRLPPMGRSAHCRRSGVPIDFIKGA